MRRRLGWAALGILVLLAVGFTWTRKAEEAIEQLIDPVTNTIRIITLDGRSEPPLSETATARFYYDTSGNALKISTNGSAYTTFPLASIGDAAADGSTKGIAAFLAADFNAASGIISLDYTNGQAAASGVKGFLTAADWASFTAKVDATRTITATSPLLIDGTTSADLSANRTLSVGLAAADGATKGVASFVAADFNCTSGNCGIDYTNGLAADTATKGFLTAADWNTFNGKQATITAGAGLGLSGATLSTASTEAGFLVDGAASSLTCGSSAQGKMQVMDSGELQYCDGATTSVLQKGLPTQTGLTWNVTEASCTGDGAGGKLTINGSHQVICASDAGGGGGGDVTAVGSCATGDCFTSGTPSTDLTFNNATSGTVTLKTVTGALGTRTLSMPAETGTVCTTGSVCSGYQASGSYATLTGTESLTNKKIKPRVTTVATATTLACNVDNSDVCSQQNTGAASTLTISTPGGTPDPMQRVLYRIKCTNTQTYNFAAIFRFSATITAPTTCTATKTDYIGAVYNDIDTKWDVVAVDLAH